MGQETVVAHGRLRQLFYGYCTLEMPQTADRDADVYCDDGVSALALHDSLLSLLEDVHLITYPPSSDFQRRWWKWAIGLLEDLLRREDDASLEEIDERIYEHYTSLLECNTGSGTATLFAGTGPPQPSYIRYFLNARQSMTLLESRMTIQSGTTGLRTWQASLVLADFLMEHPDLVASSRVLELGAGAGFLGIVVATIQAGSRAPSSLHLTDVNSEVLERCKLNTNLPCNPSASHPDAHFHLLDWFDALPSDPHHSAPHATPLIDAIHADVVLGADIVYDPRIVPALVATLVLALRPRVTGTGADSPTPSPKPRTAYVALTVRNAETYGAFVSAARVALAVEEVPWRGQPFLEREGVMRPEGVVRILRIHSRPE